MIDPEQSVKRLLQPGHHLHLVGIGGAGLSAIAVVLAGRGIRVSGSDLHITPATAQLRQVGVTLYEGHAATQIEGAEAIILSSASPQSNPELVAARQAGLPIWKRHDFLGWLMADKVGIGVAGTHGKTTTTGMVAHILLAAELDPTVIMGGVIPAIGSHGRAGQGAHFVIEADEYDHMFWGLRPQIGVVTHIEHDHPDIYPTPTDYHDAFVTFARQLPATGWLVAGIDTPGVRQLCQTLGESVPTLTYGWDEAADWHAGATHVNDRGGSEFELWHDGERVGVVSLRVPGRHNVSNALAAIAVADRVGVSFETISAALATFGGIGRRFEQIGQAHAITIIDDYAHHPTEIDVTLDAARQQYPGQRVWAVWQPHTYSRTHLLQKEFAHSLAAADRVVGLPIYRSREAVGDVRTADVLALLPTNMGYDAPTHVAATTYLLEHCRPGDVVITLGAGDGNEVGLALLAALHTLELTPKEM